MKRLENKVAVVRGGANGFGEIMVELFSSEGATVIAVDDDIRELNKYESRENIHCINVNKASIQDHKTLAENIGEQFGKVDILINNTSNSDNNETVFSIHEWQQVLAENGVSSLK